MTNTNATYATSVAVDFPDYPAATVTFTNTAFFVSGNSEVLPGKQYSLTLNSTGQGTQTLPCPDNTGDAAVNWRINLPSKESGTYAIAYDAATQQLSDILAAQSTTADPDTITAALAERITEPSSDGLWARLRSSGVGSWLAAGGAWLTAFWGAANEAGARTAIGAATSAGAGTAGELATIDADGNPVRGGIEAGAVTINPAANGIYLRQRVEFSPFPPTNTWTSMTTIGNSLAFAGNEASARSAIGAEASGAGAIAVSSHETTYDHDNIPTVAQAAALAAYQAAVAVAEAGQVLTASGAGAAGFAAMGKYVPSPAMPTISERLTAGITPLDMRPIYVDTQGYIWGNRKISSLSLCRATLSDLSDAAVVATLPGGASNIWRNFIEVSPGKLAAYVLSSDAAQAGFYIIDNTTPGTVTYTRKAAGFPTTSPLRPDPTPSLQTMASDGNGRVWVCTYGTKSDADPLIYIYRSLDYGETWSLSYQSELTANTHMHCVAWDSYRNRVWACQGDEGAGGMAAVLWSDDYGATWSYLEDGNAYMFTAIVVLPDRVLFGTDRAPAGVVAWHPSTSEMQPPVVAGDFTQIYFAQPSTDTIDNRGFAGKPYYDVSTYPYKIILTFGNSQSYCDAWNLYSPDGERFYMFGFKPSPDTDPNWMRGIQGKVGTTLLGISQIQAGNEYVYSFTMPDNLLI